MSNFTYTRVFIDPEFDKTRPIFFDTETSSAPYFQSQLGGKTRLVQVNQDGRCFVYDTFYVNVDDIKHYFRDCHLIGHNLIYDLSCIDFQHWQPAKIDDTMHIARHLLPHLDSFSFKSLASFFKCKKGDEGNSNWSKSLTQEQIQYAADDVIELEKIYNKMLEIGDPTDFFTYRLDIKSVQYALRYQLNGLPIHHRNRKRMIKEVEKQLKETKSKLPDTLNINSPKQVCDFLGSEASDADTLAQMITDGDTNASLIMEARKLTKQLQFLEQKFAFDRIYGFFKPSGAKSGRWTCSALEGANPNSQNLQQLPRAMKSIFGYEESDGRWLVDIDFSSLEVFTIIGVMGEKNMAIPLREGYDFHKYCASLVYQKDYDDVDKRERTLTKGLTFSLAYGAGANTAQTMMKGTTGELVPLEIINEMKVKWLKAFPSVAHAHKQASEVFSKKDKNFAICYSPLGRPMRANSYTEYLAMPPQSAGADCMKLAIHFLYEEIPNVRICNTVHDALVIECFSKEEAEFVACKAAECFDKSWTTVLPYMNVENLYMKNQADVVKTLDQGR